RRAQDTRVGGGRPDDLRGARRGPGAGRLRQSQEVIGGVGTREYRAVKEDEGRKTKDEWWRGLPSSSVPRPSSIFLDPLPSAHAVSGAAAGGSAGSFAAEPDRPPRRREERAAHTFGRPAAGRGRPCRPSERQPGRQPRCRSPAPAERGLAGPGGPTAKTG